MTHTSVVFITCPTRQVARRLAEQLVQRRLAACVNIVGGVESVFRWKGKMQRDREVLLIAKTRAASFERLRRAVASLHPYEVPEIIAVRVAAGHRPYLRWVTLTCQEGVRHT